MVLTRRRYRSEARSAEDNENKFVNQQPPLNTRQETHIPEEALLGRMLLFKRCALCVVNSCLRIARKSRVCALDSPFL